MRFIISLLINGLLVYLAAEILPGVSVAGYMEAILVAMLLGFVNFFIRPILTILTLPITIITLGLFLLVINGAMVLLVDWLLPGFSVDGLFWAIVFTIILAIFNFFAGGLMKGKEKS
ncbi:MAG: phage holin family protein [Lewinellaceae bacterium]|nr:phage holin family protein [Phaeodactylibacter sp.]MCB0612348.1 phage holin family protein [Phaeodactylibacter sp.]MCB9346749.1 phage holin family protein [Lewinellaceae bacterium]